MQVLKRVPQCSVDLFKVGENAGLWGRRLDSPLSCNGASLNWNLVPVLFKGKNAGYSSHRTPRVTSS